MTYPNVENYSKSLFYSIETVREEMAKNLRKMHKSIKKELQMILHFGGYVLFATHRFSRLKL